MSNFEKKPELLIVIFTSRGEFQYKLSDFTADKQGTAYQKLRNHIKEIHSKDSIYSIHVVICLGYGVDHIQVISAIKYYTLSDFDNVEWFVRFVGDMGGTEALTAEGWGIIDKSRNLSIFFNGQTIIIDKV